MANDSTAGYGCRAVMTVGSTPATSGQSEYKLYDYAGAAFNTIFKVVEKRPYSKIEPAGSMCYFGI